MFESENQYSAQKQILKNLMFRITLTHKVWLVLQVYPKSWTAVYISLDNVGMWNLRTEFWARQYLGQQFYLRVYTSSQSVRDEYPIPKNALLCGRAEGRTP